MSIRFIASGRGQPACASLAGRKRLASVIDDIAARQVLADFYRLPELLAGTDTGSAPVVADVCIGSIHGPMLATNQANCEVRRMEVADGTA